MKTLYVFGFIAIAIVLTGCATNPPSGIVGWSEKFDTRSHAPDIAIVTGNDRTTLHAERDPILILAFIMVPQDDTAFIQPRLIELAKEFDVLPVTVAQVSLPPLNQETKHRYFEPVESSVSVLYDENYIAWNAYNRPASQTVYLIDSQGKIWDIATLDNLTSLLETAEHLAGAADYSG